VLSFPDLAPLNSIHNGAAIIGLAAAETGTDAGRDSGAGVRSLDIPSTKLVDGGGK
jgi:hypothetical protein